MKIFIRRSELRKTIWEWEDSTCGSYSWSLTVDHHYSLCENEEEIKLLTQDIRLPLASFYRANWWNLPKGGGARPQLELGLCACKVSPGFNIKAKKFKL